MPEPVLGLDLDGVVGDYVAAFRTYVAGTRRLDLSALPDPEAWSFVESGWGFADTDDYLATHAAAVDAGMFAWMPVMDGAAAALRQLSDDGAHIRIVTHRLVTSGQHRRAVSDTVSWLDASGVPYRDVCFVGDKSRVDADVYVDDGPHNVESLRAAGHNVVVFDAPYNRHLPGPRVADWPQASDVLARMLFDGPGR